MVTGDFKMLLTCMAVVDQFSALPYEAIDRPCH